MVRLISRIDRADAKRRLPLSSMLALVAGALLLTGCAATMPLEEAPSPTPFADHGQ